MKFKILLYSFVFVCLLLFYQVYNTNVILNHQETKIQNLNLNQAILKDSINILNNFNNNFHYFSIEGNKKIDLDFLESNRLKNKIEEKLFEMNVNGGLDNFIKLPKGNFLIENVHVINKNWVLIGFRSNKYWGESFLEVKFKKNEIHGFTSLKSFVNPL